LHRDIGNLVLHALEVENTLTELFALPGVGNGLIEAALRQANHLSANANAALIQNGDGVFVAMTKLTQYVFGGHFHVVKVDSTR
jgi:hypothetical protein